MKTNDMKLKETNGETLNAQMAYPIKIKYWKKYKITKSQENKDKATKQGNKNSRYRCTNPQSQHKYINK
jgi:hypothetical protein